MIYISFLLHIYQPPVQSPGITRKIAEESYIPLTKTLADGFNATININGSLIEQLYELGIVSPLYNLEIALENENIEITGTGMYHPIFPLVPEEVARRQILLQKKCLEKYLGKKSTKCKGIFLPEMCYSPALDQILLNEGYEWTVLSAIANPSRKPLLSKVGKTPSGLGVIFRDDLLSNRLSFDKPTPEDIIRQIHMFLNNENNSYILLALDGETFGHHVKEYRDFLPKLHSLIAKEKDMQLVRISELFKLFEYEIVAPVPSSWSTLETDLGKNPYPLWNDLKNEIHRLLWESYYTMHKIVKIAEQVPFDNEVKENMQKLADKAVHSCQWWWASKRPWYSIDMILKGANLHLAAARYALFVTNHGGDIELAKSSRDLWNKLHEIQTKLTLII